ncbi:hypothetical protein CSKR_108018 [Clonorchis sinensis]|uniref:Uncharacterized protein n=1 Tax=Clonorchis sinensis TaxID=79923 RepID=A0A3R7JVT8_CLOSI|nr:hypothetical protein CSKR_108018 [Clonorchis sinensis]
MTSMHQFGWSPNSLFVLVSTVLGLLQAPWACSTWVVSFLRPEWTTLLANSRSGLTWGGLERLEVHVSDRRLFAKSSVELQVSFELNFRGAVRRTCLERARLLNPFSIYSRNAYWSTLTVFLSPCQALPLSGLAVYLGFVQYGEVVDTHRARQRGLLDHLRCSLRYSEEGASPTITALQRLHPFEGHWHLNFRISSRPQKADIGLKDHLEGS